MSNADATTERSPADSRLDQAIAALMDGRSADARALVAVARSEEPERARVHAVEGFIEARLGRVPQAIAAYEKAVDRDPDYVVALHSLALLLESTGQRVEALAKLTAVVEREPTMLDAQRRRIILLAEIGEPSAALAAATAALAVLPDAPELMLAQSVALRLAGRHTEALDVLDALLQLLPDDDAGWAASWAEKGTVLHAMGCHEAALEAFDKALEGNDGFPYALNGLGLVELELGMREAALAAFDQALAVDPNNSDAAFYRAMALEALGRYDEALTVYEAVAAQRPDKVFALNNIGKIRRDMGLIDQSIAAFRKALTIDPNQPRIHSNLLLTLLYDPRQSLDTLARAHAEWGERFGHPAGRYTDWPNDRDPDRPLRIGLVAAEFGQHALSGWLMAALRALHRPMLTIVCYSNRGIEDDVTRQLNALADDWRQVAALDDAALAALIRADAIDILIDISGHTANNRLTCFALKPAPVQASWLGYPFSTGLPAIDFSIMDKVSVRPEETRFFVEEVLTLASGRFCYEPPSTAPDVVAPPCTRQGWITFGSFNNIAKLTPEVLATWCRLLHRLPTARLILKSPSLGNPAVAARIRAAICDTGITSGRLEVRPGSDQQTLLSDYGDVDIALDPFPFGGGATSCEALWMGVPVVTMPQSQPASRQTESYLAAIDRHSWVAEDLGAYERIAIELASDQQRLAGWRANQRAVMRRSPLCDQNLFGIEFNLALRTMWRRFATSSELQD